EVFHAVVLPLALRAVYAGLAGSGPGWLVAMADRLASASGQVELVDYLWKATRIYWRIRLPAVALVSLAEVAVLAASFPRAGRDLARRSSWKLITISGILLGLVSSARIVGSYAGLLVTGYALIVWKGAHLRKLTAYWLLAAAAGFSLRPYFWGDPVHRLWKSLIGASDFTWQGVVLFKGETFHIWELPTQYSPVLLLQQLTIPAIVLGAAGVIALFASRSTRHHIKMIGVLLLLWTVAPLLVVELDGISCYDRYRQLMFILPPIFIFAGSAIRLVRERFPSRLALATIAAISLMPSVVAIIGLHPYEYIYLNAFAGGIRSNFRDSEMDYWCLSIREGVEFINQIAPVQSSVVVYGQPSAAQPIMRSDLDLVSPGEAIDDGADYAIICTRSNQDLRIFPEAETLFQVARKGAVLTVVRELQ
ncbi:MAG: hypothetical protein WBR18_15560, partial [Anaerolineales bacterium]